jgi:hypothetical protein
MYFTATSVLSYSRVGCLYALCTAAIFLSCVADGSGKVLFILFRDGKQLQILLFKTSVVLRFACSDASNIFTTVETRTGLWVDLLAMTKYIESVSFCLLPYPFILNLEILLEEKNLHKKKKTHTKIN